MIEAVILAEYSGAALITLMITSIGASVAYRCYKMGQMDYTFRIALALVINNFFMSCFSMWRAIYTMRRMRNEPSAWMMDHWIIPVFVIGIVIGGLIIIKALTEDSPYDRMMTVCTASVIFIMALITVFFGF